MKRFLQACLLMAFALPIAAMLLVWEKLATLRHRKFPGMDQSP
jgi:hypothetical protein